MTQLQVPLQAPARFVLHSERLGPLPLINHFLQRIGLEALTLYAFSAENWKRPRAEVETLWRLLRYYLRQELPDLQKNDVRLQAIGRLQALVVGAGLNHFELPETLADPRSPLGRAVLGLLGS